MTLKLSIRMASALKSADNSPTGVMACDGRTGEALVRRGYAAKAGLRGYVRTTEGAGVFNPQAEQESADRVAATVAAMMATMDELAAEVEAEVPAIVAEPKPQAAERTHTVNTAHVKAMAYEVCYGATGKVRAQFIALAKANGYEGAAGGWIYRTGSTDPIAQGWTALAGRVLCDAITLDTASLTPVAEPTEPRFPQGTPEYAAYKAELQAELDKFAKREAPYDQDELAEPLTPGQAYLARIEAARPEVEADNAIPCAHPYRFHDHGNCRRAAERLA